MAGRCSRTAAKTIQVYVSNLRKALGAARDTLETHGSGYLLRVRPGELDLTSSSGSWNEPRRGARGARDDTSLGSVALARRAAG